MSQSIFAITYLIETISYGIGMVLAYNLVLGAAYTVQLRMNL